MLDDLSPETPSCPAELTCGSVSHRQIPIFTFTCDEDDVDSHDLSRNKHVPHEGPPPVPAPPVNYDQFSDNGEIISLPPEMKPINTRFMLNLCNSRVKEECYTRRCTSVGDCVSACECCRIPQPETPQIPYIDEPNCEPVIFEKDGVNKKIATPKIRRILPSLSLDKLEGKKPATADAMCQTPPSPSEVEKRPISSVRVARQKSKFKFSDEFKNLQDVHCRLKRTILNMTKSLSIKSDETEDTSTQSVKDHGINEKEVSVFPRKMSENVRVTPDERKQILGGIEQKTWKSPDEYRPAFGKVKALTKRFNEINLTYSVKTYRRNCQSSPNLSIRMEMSPKHKLSLPVSTSLGDIQYAESKADTSESKSKMSEEEVRSILIQLEDWSKFGSRGSEDTLAQGNEFELPNLPSEDHTETNASINGSIIFNEIDKKPKIITLDNIKLKTKKCGAVSPLKVSKDSCISESIENWDGSSDPRVVGVIRRSHASSSDVSTCRMSEDTAWSAALAQSCPELSASDRCLSCPTSLLLSTDTSSRKTSPHSA